MFCKSKLISQHFSNLKLCVRHLSNFKRCPVIGVLGHVDHGKTTLIDSLRQTNNVSFEAGRITQKNSIFQHTITETDFKFTIVDTPGHAAFSKMRVTGATITDVAILVVDAVEGVKEQTRECINLLKKNEMPLVVAINKIDLPRSDPERCYEMLFEEGIDTVQVGGSTPCVGISALKGTNIPELMMAVQGVAEGLDVYNTRSDGVMEGVLFDLALDKKMLVSTTLLVQRGSITKGDVLITDSHASRVRDLKTVEGERLSVGLPGMPVTIVAQQTYSEYLQAGSTIYSVTPGNKSRDRENKELYKVYQENVIENIRQEKIYERLPEGKKKVSFIIKADNNSTIEIIRQMLELEHDEVELSVFSDSTKPLTAQELQIAEQINAEIILFNMKPLDMPTSCNVHQFDIIYELAESVNQAINTALPPKIVRTVVGRGNIAQIHGTKKKRIAGINNMSGKFSVGMQFAIVRQGFEFWRGRVETLRYLKTSLLETTDGMKECGIQFPKNAVSRIAEHDRVKCFYESEKDRQFISNKFFGKDARDESDDSPDEIEDFKQHRY